MRALELYCGIGGFTAAVENAFDVEVVAALDASPHVIQTYNQNWEPVGSQTNLLSLGADDFADFDADLWWMSPPCAPYTRRGNKEDLDDCRAESFIHILEVLRDVRPTVLALENVEGFAESRAREELLARLDGYEIRERVIRPTELGVPSRRPRYYLVASAVGAREFDIAPQPLKDWRDYRIDEAELDLEPLIVPDDVMEKYGDGFRILGTGESYTTCFTGSYGKSWSFTGSYLQLDDGRLRRFAPEEVLRFLGFPHDYTFPDDFSPKQRWKYAGNSLSVPAVRTVLDTVATRQSASGEGERPRTRS